MAELRMDIGPRDSVGRQEVVKKKRRKSVTRTALEA